jgi:hypothetical protein
MAPDSSPTAFDGARTLELALRDREGAPWVLRLSPAMTRFIGAYPRLDGFGGDGALLDFRSVGQTA